MIQNIFLDLGSHFCEGLRHFITKKILPIDKNWEIHCFEPNPLINFNYNKYTFLQNKDLNINFHKKAVWIENDEFVFKMFGNNGDSIGSLLEKTEGGKNYQDYHSSSVVECIDLFSFIKEKFNENDKIYIKMDIEFAEYEVLQNMIERGWPQNIVKIWVEFHDLHDSMYANKAKDIISKIQGNSSTEVILWH